MKQKQFSLMSVLFVSFVTKRDEAYQKPWSVLVMKQGETKCNNVTDTIPSLYFFINTFLFCNNELNKIYRENSETG